MLYSRNFQHIQDASYPVYHSASTAAKKPRINRITHKKAKTPIPKTSSPRPAAESKPVAVCMAPPPARAHSRAIATLSSTGSMRSRSGCTSPTSCPSSRIASGFSTLSARRTVRYYRARRVHGLVPRKCINGLQRLPVIRSTRIRAERAGRAWSRGGVPVYDSLK